MNKKTWINKIIYLFLFFFAFSLKAEDPKTPYLLVSIAPYKFFVEKIAGNTVQVGLMVPAGASAHSYEPTPKQIFSASTASLWFRIGETFEDRVIEALKSHNPNLKVIDLRQGLDLIGSTPGGCACCHASSMDLHFWLSARLGQIQAKTIAEALILQYPANAALYRTNLDKFLKELQNLDKEIQTILASIQNRNILVSHPAYAYFCRDYDLKQYSIEFEGKDPTPQQLNKTLTLARELKIQTIFTQIQYSSKGAKLIASDIGAKVFMLDPYSENFFNSMLTIAHAFAEG
ncbi:MAG: zinc ABC transporter substrate-binding protein [Parachlamydiaceae bacterium]|nr:zinc ABC transporter substrate-binding protein [Parachlamydiaceae bacterium]